MNVIRSSRDPLLAALSGTFRAFVEQSSHPKVFFDRAKEDVKKTTKGVPLGSSEVYVRKQHARQNESQHETPAPEWWLFHGMLLFVCGVLWFLDRLVPEPLDSGTDEKAKADRQVEGATYVPHMHPPYLAVQLTNAKVSQTADAAVSELSSFGVSGATSYFASFDIVDNKIAIGLSDAPHVETKRKSSTFGATLTVLPSGTSSLAEHPHDVFAVTVTSWGSPLNAPHRDMPASVRPLFLKELGVAFGPEAAIHVEV